MQSVVTGICNTPLRDCRRIPLSLLVLDRYQLSLKMIFWMNIVLLLIAFYPAVQSTFFLKPLVAASICRQLLIILRSKILIHILHLHLPFLPMDILETVSVLEE